MTGDEMRDIRVSLRLNPVEFGEELGYKGSKNTIFTTVRRYENGAKPIPAWIATAARALHGDAISDIIFDEVGEQLDFETINRVSDAIIDYLVPAEE
jgi:hypothetical protein